MRESRGGDSAQCRTRRDTDTTWSVIPTQTNKQMMNKQTGGCLGDTATGLRQALREAQSRKDEQ